MDSESVAKFKPSEYGFRSIRARSRGERRALNDKVALEKNRINQRVGHAAKMQRENAPATSAGLTTCVDGGAGYISNSDRFHSDTAGEEQQRRTEQLMKKQRAVEFRRNQAINREEDRWKRLDENKRKEEEKWDALREDGRKAMKNKSKSAYDITTLQYYADEDGDAQKYADDMVRHRAAIRSRALVVQGDSRAPYNILTGDERKLPHVGAPPQKPPNFHKSSADLRRGG